MSHPHTDHHVILRVTAKFLIPIITLYAFYVQFHGDYSPGGGFQAGVIFAVGIILYALVFGVVEAMTRFPACSGAFPGHLRLFSLRRGRCLCADEWWQFPRL